MLYRQNLAQGALFIVASEFGLACSGALIKLSAQDLPNEMIVFYRNFFGLLVLAPFCLRNGVSGLKTRVFHLHLLRGVVGLGAMYCFFYAIGHIKLVDAMLLKLTAPIFIPIIAWLWLKERLSPLAKVALLIGFVGVALVLRPAGEMSWIMLVALAGSLLAAVIKVSVRRLSHTEPAFRIVFYFAAIATAVSSVPLLWGWQTPATGDWGLLLSIAILATVSQLLMTRGYAAAPASQVGIFTYSAVMFGGLLGWWFWGELWDWTSAIGAVLIVIAGAMVLRSGETRSYKSVGEEQQDGVIVTDAEKWGR